MDNDIARTQIAKKQAILSNDYRNWRKEIILLIEQSKLKAILSVNSELLTLYWKIGNDILTKQKEQGWGTKVIEQLSKDLMERFPDDRGYSERNLRNMKKICKPIFHFSNLASATCRIRKIANPESCTCRITL